MTVVPTAALAQRHEAFQRAMLASPGDLDLVIPPDQVQGRIPHPLRGGRLYSNGPGWLHIGDRIAHPFDGHGYVRAFEFRPDGGCGMRARFVKTPVYQAERAAGRLLQRGLGTLVGPRFGPRWRARGPRNVANTSIVPWGGRLLAGWEGGTPYALDPISLETLGEETFGGVLAKQATLAHMRHDAKAGCLVTCSVQMGRKTRFTFREFDPHGALQRSYEALLPGLRFTHDFALTPGWCVLADNPLRPRPEGMFKVLLGTGTLLGAVAPDTKAPGALWLVARDGSGRTRRIDLPHTAHVIHFANAFDRDGSVVVDACVFHHFTLGEEFGYTGPKTAFDPRLPEARGPQQLYRMTISPDATRADWQRLTPYGVDFPRIHPAHEGQDTPRIFGATRRDPRFSDPFDTIIGLDTHSLDAPVDLYTVEDPCTFVGEPIFVPDAVNSGTGWVLVMLTNGALQGSTLAIFDAYHLSRGPVACVPLPLLPLAFHGSWHGGEAAGFEK